MKKFITGFLAALYILFFFGILGLINGVSRERDKAVVMFTIIACINVILWIVLIKLIIKIFI